MRGVGKTVLLNRVAEVSRELGFRVATMEVLESRDIRTLLVPILRSILFDLDRMEGLSENVKRAFRVLKSFASGIRIAGFGLELGVDAEAGIADSGILDVDLQQLFVAIGEAAKSRASALVLVADELQYLSEDDFAALIVAIHRVTQANLPIILVGAGLPSILGLAGRAKSYAERLFDFPIIGALDDVSLRDAVQLPAQRENANFSEGAIIEVARVTGGYPYFIQEWAYHAWNVAAGPQIHEADVRRASESTIRSLDESFFRVRLDRFTNAEKRYLRAMASLGPGPHRSGDIAEAYGTRVQSVGPLRAALITKGMIYAPLHGETAFTVPLFDEFMMRTIPTQAALR